MPNPPLPRSRRSALLPAAVLLLVLAVLTWQVVAHGPLLGVDTAVRGWVQGRRRALGSPLLDGAAEAVSDLGAAAVAGPLLGLAAGVSALARRRRGRARWWLPLLVAAAAAAVLLGTVIPGKALIGRPGPAGAATGTGGWGYFPSGHAATSAGLLGAALLLVLDAIRGRRARRLLTAGTVLLLAAVGAALIWRNYHWLLDVLASWCLAGAVLLGAAAGLRRGSG